MTARAPSFDALVLLTPRDIGGHEIALMSWLAEAVNDGLRPAVFAPDDRLARFVIHHGLGATLLPIPAGRANWRSTLQVLYRWPRTRPLLLAPGVVHADGRLLAAALGFRHRVWVYVPMAWTARRMGYRHARLRDALLAPWTSGVERWIAIDERQAHALRTDWGVTRPVHVLPNVVTVVDSRPAPQPAADDRLRVAYVGRFDIWQKGLDWLATLIARETRWRETCRWRFQGSGSGEGALLELASAIGPQHAVVQPHGPIDAALAASDVLLLPSRYEGEPLVALEATVRGWPVVASRESGLGALLPSSSQFDFGDADGLARALASLREPAARRQAAAHARARYDGPARTARRRRALGAIVQAARALPC